LVELCLPDTTAKLPSDGFAEIKAGLIALRSKA